MKLIENKEEAHGIRDALPAGTRYFKCSVHPFYLSIDDPEDWGYCFAKDLKEAKKAFSKAIEEEIDGPLDYGFMVICEYERVHEELRSGKLIDIYVNDFGTWKKRIDFIREKYGIGK